MPLQESNRLIKAHNVRSPGSNAAFNIEDLRRQCDEYIAQARKCGEELISQAAARADELRRRAFEQGLREGQQAGYDAAQDVIESRARELAAELTRKQLETVLPALDHVVEILGEERERWLTDWETAAIRLSAVMAEKLFRRELSQRPETVVDMIREALQLAAGSPQITLRLNPLDLDQLNANGNDIIERLSRVGETALTPDESVSRGGCLIETRQGIIDARIETQLARIVDELLRT
jgi:flagellar assembly protein FliH